MKEEKEEQARNADAPKPPDHAKVIEGLFHMACIWTVGGVVDSKGRGAFSEYFRLLLAGTDIAAAYEGRISVTPLHIDLTHLETARALKAVLGGAPPKERPAS